MQSAEDWLQAVIERKQIVASVRAIIFDRAYERVLVEKSFGAMGQFVNFIGGKLELGETFEACLRREMNEETNTEIVAMSYLFVVENFITCRSQIAHGLEHYYEAQLDREEIESREDTSEYPWIRVAQLGEVTLRPLVVRDCILDGSFRTIRHLVSKSVVA